MPRLAAHNSFLSICIGIGWISWILCLNHRWCWWSLMRLKTETLRHITEQFRVNAIKAWLRLHVILAYNKNPHWNPIHTSILNRVSNAEQISALGLTRCTVRYWIHDHKQQHSIKKAGDSDDNSMTRNDFIIHTSIPIYRWIHFTISGFIYLFRICNAVMSVRIACQCKHTHTPQIHCILHWIFNQ